MCQGEGADEEYRGHGAKDRLDNDAAEMTAEDETLRLRGDAGETEGAHGQRTMPPMRRPTPAATLLTLSV
jgi:hypothetical protein